VVLFECVGEMGNANSLLSKTTTEASSSSCGSQCSIVALAMMAVARNCTLDRVQIVALRNAMAGLCDKNEMIDKEGFDTALELAQLSNVAEIFHLLFTMWDNAGIDRVPFKEFCVGISPLACPHDDIHTILRFALRMSDEINRGCIELHELHRLLSSKAIQKNMTKDSTLRYDSEQ
jgi:Ca2+-binding EF-hand superfamily protein